MEDGVVRHVGGSQDMHKSFAPPHRHLEIPRDSLSHLYRRSIDPRPRSSTTGQVDGDRNGAPATSSRSAVKACKRKSISFSDVQMSGHHLGHGKNELPHTCETHQSFAEFGPTTITDVRRRPSSHPGPRPVCRTSGIDVAGYPPGEASSPPYPARTRESNQAAGMERSVHPLTGSPSGFGMVGDRGALEGERKLHRSACEAHTSLTSHGRRHKQCRLRRGDDSRLKRIPHTRFSDRR